MPIIHISLTRAIDEFRNHMVAAGIAPGTLMNKDRALAVLASVVGPTQPVRSMTPEMFDNTLLKLGETRGYVSLKMDRTTFRQFVQFAKRNRYLPYRFDDLTEIVRSSRDDGNKEKDTRHQFIPVENWPAVLAAAEKRSPRVRMMFALGFYMGLRVSEAKILQWKDIDLGRLEASVWSVKRRKHNVLPIGAADSPLPLESEIRSYQDWYRGMCGGLEPAWYVLPSRLAPSEFTGRYTHQVVHRDPALWPMDPKRETAKGQLILDLKKTMGDFGWDDDDLKGQGLHLLRRSCAVFLDANDQLPLAQALLRHTHRSTTEIYTRNVAGRRKLAEFMGPRTPRQPDPTGSPSNVIDLASRRRAV